MANLIPNNVLLPVFYTGRQNFGFAARGMQEEMALSATSLGLFNAVLLLGYGVGQAINGNLGDIYGARRMVTIGALFSVALNWAVSFAPNFTMALVCWGANGLAQSCAWPAMNRAIAHWWPRRERGKALGMYLLAAGFSSTLTFLLCILVIRHLDWRWVFRLPVLFLIVGGAGFGVFVRNSPQDDGFPPLPNEPQDKATAAAGRETSFERYWHVLQNRPFQLACLSIGCESIARYGLINWVPVHFLGPNWHEGTGGLWITLALPFGMAAGALAAGLIADRWFPESRSRVVLYFLGLAAVGALLLAGLASGPAIAMLLLALTGFLVYGPQATYWALCPELVGRERSGTAVGLMDASAYGFAALGQVIIGWAIDITHSTAAAFVVIAAACILGAILLLPVKK
jgi:MFS transporter, OPA family, glycerol-3-phosphate transporter